MLNCVSAELGAIEGVTPAIPDGQERICCDAVIIYGRAGYGNGGQRFASARAPNIMTWGETRFCP